MQPWQSIGQWFAWRVLGAPKGSLVSRYSQVYTSFALSAAIHVVAAVAADPTRRYSGTCSFFIAQAHGILAEDFAQWAGRKMGVRKSGLTHLVGAIWVVFWFTWAFPWFADESIQLGLVARHPEPLPLLLIRGLRAVL